MALIGKIRKNFWFVLILLGLALAAFILMDMTSASNMGGAGAMSIGNVGGKKLDYREFQTVEQTYYGGSNSDVFAKRNTVWDFFVERALVESEADDLGLKVGTEELMDLQFGPKPSSIIQANWRNQQTGQLDLANLNQIKTTIENNEEMNPRFRQYWAEQEKHIIKDQLQTKMNNLVSKGIYAPNWMAESFFKEGNDKVDFKYVKIPFDKIADSEVSLTDADYSNYINKNSHTFKNDEETRVIEYASFDVVPTAADTTMWQDSIQGMKVQFGTSSNDSLFALNHNGAYQNYFFKLEDLPESARSLVSGAQVGDVVGPYTENNAYNLIKLIDKRVVPDSVAASHILISAPENDKAALAVAQVKADSIISRYTKGLESFDSLAIKNSQDPASATKGGDLGTFAQGQMVPEFNNACFILGKKGGTYKVVSRFGIHFIKINDRIFNNQDFKYSVATAALPIVPSEETQNVMFDKVSDIVADNRDISTLRGVLEAENISLSTSEAVKINDFKFDALEADQVTREIVKWAFDEPNEIGDVSPEVYTYTDKALYYNNKFVVATLKEIVPKGIPSVSSVKDKIQALVMNQKKGEMISSSIAAGSLEDLATENGTTVETINDIALTSGFVPGLGNEKEVLSTAFGLDNMAISKPIVGSSGVFVIQPLSKQEAGPVVNLPLVKGNASSDARSRVSFGLMDALKKKTKIEDSRSTFY